MVDGDRTIGELARQIESMRRDQAQQARALQDQLRSLVSLEYLNLLEKRLNDRITDIVKDIAEEETERKAEIGSLRAGIRYIIGLLVAAAAIIIPLLFRAGGAS